MAKTDHSREFRDRRARMWRTAAVPIVLVIGGGVCAVAIGTVDAESSGSETIVMALAMSALLIGIVGIILAVNRHIKCPNCGKVPTDEGAVDLSAKTCPHCGTRLA